MINRSAYGEVPGCHLALPPVCVLSYCKVLGHHLFPILSILGFAGLVVFVLRAGMISSRNTARVSSNYKLWMPPCLVELFPKRSEDKKGITIFT